MKTRICYAYGSNMDPTQMRRRCPTARALGPARLGGHRLVFRGHSAFWGGGVASVVRARGSAVDGVLYEVSAADLDMLDRYEGHPFVYRRVTRAVTDGSGRRRRAQVYVMRRERGAAALPAPGYVGVLWRAYRRLGFDCDVLWDAVLGGAP